MTTYGNPARISVDMVGGGVTGISGGEEQKAVIFGRGNTEEGTADPNQPTQVFSTNGATEEFGEGSEIVEYLDQVSSNGLSYNLTWGIMPEEIEIVEEDITGSGEGASHTDGSKIENGPLVEDTELIEVTGSNGEPLQVEFRYETNTGDGSNDFSDLSPDEGEIFINCNTREWNAGTADDYSITYTYVDWESAFESATDVIEEQEAGVWGIGAESSSIISTAQEMAEPLRQEQWKMITVFGLAEPNQTGDDNGAEISVGDFEPGVDDDSVFLIAPGRLNGEITRAIGAVTGIAAGNEIDNPIIGEELAEIGNLEQTLNVPEQVALSNSGAIPLSNNGTPSIEGNMSTSTDEDWIRSYFARRLGDYLILAARAIARITRGKLNNDNTETIVEQQLSDEIVDFIDDGVLEPNDGEDQSWFVNAENDTENPRNLDLEFGFTPTGVVDTVNITATIDY